MRNAIAREAARWAMQMQEKQHDERMQEKQHDERMQEKQHDEWMQEKQHDEQCDCKRSSTMSNANAR